MFPDNKLPTEQQREKLCELMHYAFIDLRYLEGKQANDLAYAFHNLPMEMYDHGKWSSATTRKRLEHYQNKYQDHPGTDYVTMLDKIFK
jgi:hypothetical protein